MNRWCRLSLVAIVWLSTTAANHPVDPRRPNHRATFQPVPANGIENAQWGDEFNLPFANGTVYCSTIFQGDLIVGGDFTSIGGKPISYLARWDGSGWAPLVPNVDGPTRAFFEDGSHLLVGGLFHHAGNLEVLGLAAWDGTSWTAVAPTGVTEAGGDFLGVFAIQRFQGDLIVGGEFRSGTNPELQGIARLHQGAWQAISGGIPGRVRVLAAYRDTLYVGGDFDSAGAVPAANIARLDGSEWADIGGITRGPGSVSTLAVYNDRLYVGGYFFKAGNVDASCLASWDGTEWGAPVGLTTYLSGVDCLLNDGGSLDIGSYWGIDFWDGTTLTYGPLLLGGTLALVRRGTDLIAGGSFTTTGTSPIINVGRWDGSQMWGFSEWGPSSNGLLSELGQGGGPNQLLSYRGRLMAAGETVQGATTVWYYGTPVGLQEAWPLMAWDGASWTPIDFATTPFTGIPTYMVATNETLYLAGNFAERGEPTHQNHVIAFDGQTWSGLEGLTATVRLMTLADDDLYVSTYTAAQDPPHVYRWINGAWEDIGAAQGQDTNCSSVLGTLGEFQGKLVAIGSFTSIGGVPAHGAAIWDGSQWHPMGSGTRNCFRSDARAHTAQFQGQLIVPTYSCDCSSSTTDLEAWDGQQWATVATLEGFVNALATAKDKLYVAGSYGSSFSWNGLRWEKLEPSPNGYVVTMAPHGEDVYFGGSFSGVGSKGSFGIARLLGMNTPPPTQKVWLSPAAPNPSSSTSDFSIHLTRGGSVRVAVHDVRGRELAVLHKGEMTAGYHAIRWDGRDRSGKVTPAGIYFIAVQSPDGLATGKIVRVK